MATAARAYAATPLSGAWRKEPEQGSFGRLWRVFMSARVAIALVLATLQAAIYAMGNVMDPWSIGVSSVYLLATLAVLFWARPRPPRSHFDAQWLSTIGVDVIAFSLLNFLQVSGINYTPLFALPVLLSSILGPIMLAFGTAATVTILLLGEAWWGSAHGMGEVSSRLLQAGLNGSGFFLVALLANQLALRLARQEKLVLASQSIAQMQIQINELVIETLSDGVLLVDAQGTVRSANPAARQLLQAPDQPWVIPFQLIGVEPLQALTSLVHQTFRGPGQQNAEINLLYPGGNVRSLHVRSRLAISPDNNHESLCVLFLQDLREMQARLRIEKMAAMGRMSAAVAHEIRNPLAAISQANALLEEDLHDAGHRRLVAMIGQNAQRLAKIVDEVLDISRAQAQMPAPKATTLMLDDTAERIGTDWARQNDVQTRVDLNFHAPGAVVHFDVDHLQRILVNLLDNALRYASAAPGAIDISTRMANPGQARIAVWSDGAPLEASVQNHLFEPFFSSESRSSGLGLYICRELCERYGASIGYQRVGRNGRAGNEFFVMFAPVVPFADSSPSSLDTILI